MSAEIFFKRAVFGEIYSLKKILKKYLTKGEKSGKIGKLSERVAKNTALKALSKLREKI